MFASQSRPHIILVGNQKGGSGKSTLAMHVAIALLKSGQHVVSIDLDHGQRTLTRYIENRRETAKSDRNPLQAPEHICIDDLSHRGIKWNDADRIEALSDLVRSYDGACDFILIDTAGNDCRLNLFAHGLADTLVTPVNDSFLDLDVIFSMGPTPNTMLKPSRYAQTVMRALEARRAIGQRETDWIVVRNRISPLASRNERGIIQALDTLAQRSTFRLASGLVERVVYREFFPLGLTTFDSFETSRLGVKPSMSHVLARLEVRQLIATLNLPLNPTGLVPDDSAGQDPLKSGPVDGDLRQLLIPDS
jgi:chromosome partitioning protein